MRWFGTSWRAPVCDPDQQIAVPVDSTCGRCAQPIGANGRGVVLPHIDENERLHQEPWHLNCFMTELGLPPVPVRQACRCDKPAMKFVDGPRMGGYTLDCANCGDCLDLRAKERRYGQT